MFSNRSSLKSTKSKDTDFTVISEHYFSTSNKNLKAFSTNKSNNQTRLKQNNNHYKNDNITNKDFSNKLSNFDDIEKKEKNETLLTYQDSFISQVSSKSTSHKINNLKSSFFILLATFILSLVNLCGKTIGFYYPEVNISSTNLIRGITLVGLSHIFFSKFNIKPIEEILLQKKKKAENKNLTIIYLILRCICGATCHIIFFQSLTCMRISSAYTIFSLSPIFSSILSILIVKEKFSKTDLFSFFACFVGVCLLTKPAFIFGSAFGGLGDTFIGFILALISAIINGIGVFLTKYISNDFHFSIAPYIMGYFYIFECSAILIFSENGFFTLSFVPFLLSVVLSLLFYFSVNCFIYGLAMGNPIKVLPIVYTGIIFNLIYNSFIFQQACDLLDLVGSFIIVVVNVYKSLLQQK